ncbi:transposase [Catenibacterium mitsuokai]|uniref:transposase n=1 Tax=Catenibacterium mitsuokai TaxID=100886 RepID=UPI0022E54424|nr:transposase [Catenibacterium mitsuokai]
MEKTYKNIHNSAELKKLEKSLFENREVFLESMKIYRKESPLKKKKYTKSRLKIQKLHHKIDNIRTDYINKIIAEIVKTKPSYITIEDLNVSGMMKNKHLSKAVASQNFQM